MTDVRVIALERRAASLQAVHQKAFQETTDLEKRKLIKRLCALLIGVEKLISNSWIEPDSADVLLRIFEEPM